MSLKKKYGLPETATDAELEKAMSEAFAKAAAKPEVDDKIAADLAKSQADLAKANAVAAMSDISKARYAELAKDEPAAAAWLAKSEADRVAILDLEKKGDENFKDADGNVISKRAVGDQVFAMLKGMNDRVVKQAEELSIEKTLREASDLEKRASTEFGNIAKAAEVVSILRIAKRAPKEDGEAIVSLLKQHNELLSMGLRKAGHRGETTAGAVDDPDAKLDAMCKSYAKEKGISESQAYAKVLETPEGADLYHAINAQ